MAEVREIKVIGRDERYMIVGDWLYPEAGGLPIGKVKKFLTVNGFAEAEEKDVEWID